MMKVNTAVHVKEFLVMSQDSDEPVRNLYALLREKPSRVTAQKSFLEDTITFVEGKEGGQKSQMSLCNKTVINNIAED